MRNKELQISLFDTYNEMLNLMEENQPELIKLIDESMDFEAIDIPTKHFQKVLEKQR